MAKKGKLDMQFVVDTSKPVKNIKDLNSRIEKLRDTIEGAPLGSEEFERLTSQLSNASSEMKVLEKNMEGLEPQQKAEAFLKMGEGIAGAFAVGQGAMGLMGVESENLEKIQVKVQSAIAIATGIRMMSEAALMAGIAKRVIVEKLAIAQTKLAVGWSKAAAVGNALWAIGQGVVTGSVAATTIGMHALKAAIISTGIGALALLIIGLVVAVVSYTKSTSGAETATVRHTKEMLKYNQAIRDNAKALNKKLDRQEALDAADGEREKTLVSQTHKLEDLNEELNTMIKRSEENDEIMSRPGYEDWAKRNKKVVDAVNARVVSLTEAITKQRAFIITTEGNIEADKKLEASNNALAADQKRIDDERRARGKARRTQKESDAKSLRKLEEELLLLEVQDAEEREQLKREQDLANELSDAKNIGDKTIRLETLANIQDIYDQNELNRLKKIEDEKQKIIDDAAAEKIKAAKEAQDEIDKTTDAYFEQIRRKNLENRDREIEDANKHFDEMMLAEGLTGDEKIQLLTDHQENIKAINKVYDDEDLASADEVNAQKLDAIMQLADSINANMDARLTELDNAMNRELEMEGLTQEQKKTINEKYQKKKDKIAARQKAIQASQAIINTFVGATRAVADLGPIAGPIAAGAIVLGGLASVRQIYAQDVGGGGGGGGGDTPDVESTPAPKTGSFTLSGETDKQDTIKAYVVTDEVTDSQSQLEDIRQQATI